jgi:DNA-binding transcriptional regulator YhcF (GntR family)
MARWLLRMRDLVGDDLPVTQEYLAAMIGVNRTTVSPIAGAMQEAGIIRYVRGHIHVGNVEILKKHSCECYQAVRDNYEALLGTPWPICEDKPRTSE